MPPPNPAGPRARQTGWPGRPGPGPGVPPLVGRADAYAALNAAWSEAAGGQRRAVLVHGEPGIGKTRLAAELTGQVATEGFTAVYGRWDEDVPVPYRGFVEALRSMLEAYDDADLAELAESVGPLAGELLLVAPGLAERLQSVRPTRRTLTEGEEGDRHRIYEAVTRMITAVARRNPLLMVLDDIHWAGRASLGMLVHLLRSGGAAPLLIVGLYRDTEVERDHPLVPVLAELRSVPGVTRLPLPRLDRESVVELVSGVVPSARPAADDLYTETAGNPLFLVQVLRDIGEGGALPVATPARGGDPAVAVPEGVRQLVSRRLGRLQPQVAELVEAASVLGVETPAWLLAALDDTPGIDLVLDGLEAATRAGFLTEVPDGRGIFRFAHALVRRAVYESLPRARRGRIHLQAAAALEVMDEVDEGRTGAIAHHLFSAAPLGDAVRAAGYLRLAAEEAMSRLSFEAAVLQLERAVALVPTEDRIGREERSELLLLLALARFRTGDLAGSRQAAARAAEDAKEIGAAELQARAATRYVSFVVTGDEDPVAPELCQEALARLPADSDVLRAQVLARLGTYAFWAEGDGERALALTAEAVERAQRSNDVETLVSSYSARLVAMMCRPNAAEAFAIVAELGRLADEHDNRRYRGDAITGAAVASLVAGDASGFATAAEELVALGERERYWPFVAYGCVWRSTLAAMTGRLDAAIAEAGEALRYGGELPDFRNTYMAQTLIVAREQGRLAQVEPMLIAARAAYPRLAVLRPIGAIVHVILGQHDLARAELAELCADDFALVARDFAWVVSLALLAEATASLGRTEEAELILSQLQPFSGSFATAGGVVCLGAVDRYLAMLADVLGRDGEADDRFAAAETIESAAGARALLARTHLWHARCLLRRGDDPAVARAGELLADARRAAGELGMAGLIAELAVLEA